MVDKLDIEHDSMTNVMTDLPMVNFHYLSRNIQESYAYVACVSHVMLGFVRNMKIFCSHMLKGLFTECNI